MPLAPIREFTVVDPKTGQIVCCPDGTPKKGWGINDIKMFVRGYWLTPPEKCSDQLPVSLTAFGTPGDTVILTYIIDTQGHFDWAYIMGEISGTVVNGFSLEFFDAQRNRRLQNKPVLSNNMVGSAFRPFMLPEPYFFDVGDSSREIQIIVRNLETTTRTVSLTLYGRRFYHKEMPPQLAQEVREKWALKGYRTYPYFLAPVEVPANGVVVDSIAPSGTFTFTFDMDDDADMECRKLLMSPVSSFASFTFALREREFNRTISNGAILGTLGFGTPEFPVNLLDSFLLERKKQLLLEITNTGIAPITLTPMIAGRRLHYR